jgi:ferrochelatase
MLLITLGSPAAPTVRAVHSYLAEFLTDPLVIDIPTALRQVLVRGWIAPTRAPKSAAAYRKIWGPDGSPLIAHTQDFTDKVREELAQRFDVRWAARYGSPGIRQHFEKWNISELYVVPLYPQYASSSTRSALDEVRAAIQQSGMKIKLRVLRDFFAEPEFIASQSQQIRRVAEEFQPDHYLLSFHGLPVHHLQNLHPQRCLLASACCEKVEISNRWCYRAQCMATARGLMTALAVPPGRVTVSFQSRLGRRPWIKPYTDEILPELVQSGVRRLLVSCPSFVADCLETLEEVEMRLREQFLGLGGEAFEMVPALNDEDHWVREFSQMVTRHNLHWWDG